MQLRSAPPDVTLTKYFHTPYDNAVATARTCYSSRIITDDDVRKKPGLRDRIARSIYLAGHHTTLQHAHFQFAINNLSRQALWSFFHAHPFYNSEQVSQRYVEVKKAHFARPALGDEGLDGFFDAVLERQMGVYRQLLTDLEPAATAAFLETFPARRRRIHDDRWQRAIKKRCQEVARYVLPIATHAHLYHTISGLTLHRYRRLAGLPGCPEEQRQAIEAMCHAVQQVDPLFFDHLEDVIDEDSTLEGRLFQRFFDHGPSADDTRAFNREFDAALEGRTSKLVSFSPHPDALLAQGLRESLGLPQSRLSDDDAVALLLDPQHNRYLGESLNLHSLAKAPRAMELVHFTFKKRLSHSADSQAQRHRMTPGVRPRLTTQVVPGEPDYVTPTLFDRPEAARALDVYRQEMAQVYNDIAHLQDRGVGDEAWQYLLPNSVTIRFTETGSLMHQHHKWTTRLCFNAQEEIWSSVKDEVEQVTAHAPAIGRWLLPPCGLRHRAEVSPKCPEGERYCGVRVWTQTLPEYARKL